MASPKPGEDLPLGKGATVAVLFKGGAASPAAGLKLGIYSNKDARKPVFSTDIAPGPAFELALPLPARRGLYYFTVRNGQGEAVFTGKFTLGK